MEIAERLRKSFVHIRIGEFLMADHRAQLDSSRPVTTMSWQTSFN
jgi:hypothetical protein